MKKIASLFLSGCCLAPLLWGAAIDRLDFPTNEEGADSYYRVDSDYGPRNVSDASFFHRGLDLNVAGAGDVGEPIFSQENGVVFGVGSTGVIPGDTRTGLKWVGINYGGGRTFAYLHVFVQEDSQQTVNFRRVVLEENQPIRSVERVIRNNRNNDGCLIFWSEEDGAGSIVKIISHSTAPVVIGTTTYTPRITVSKGEVIAPLGNSGTNNAHIHIQVSHPDDELSNRKQPGQIGNDGRDSVMYWLRHDPSQFRGEWISPAKGAAVHLSGNGDQERLALDVVKLSPGTDWAKFTGYDFDRASFYVLPTTMTVTTSTVRNFLTADRRINGSRDTAVPTINNQNYFELPDRRDAFRGVITYGGLPGDSAFPAYMDNTEDPPLGKTDDVRTGIRATGAFPAPTRMVFNQWNSKAAAGFSDVNGDGFADGALLNEKARHPDGEYRLIAHLENIYRPGDTDLSTGESLYRDSVTPLDHKIILDNFRPYLKSVEARQDGAVVYRGSWSVTGSSLTFGPSDMLLAYPEEITNQAGLTLTLTFSEPMRGVSARLESQTIGPWKTVDAASTTWKATAPFGIMAGVPAQSAFRLRVEAQDLSGNALYPFDDERALTDVAGLGRAADGAMPDAGGPDTLHRLRAPFSVAVDPLIPTLGVNPMPFELVIKNHWLTPGTFALDGSFTPAVPGWTTTLSSWAPLSRSVSVGQERREPFTIANAGGTGTFEGVIQVKGGWLTAQLGQNASAPSSGGGNDGGGGGGALGPMAWMPQPVSANHPDDNHSVADSRYSHPWLIDTAAEIGVMLAGYADGVGHMLGAFRMPTALVDEDLRVRGPERRSLADLKVLIIPSGALTGKNTGSFRAKLRAYLDAGGAVVALDQPMGADFAALPRGDEIRAYGWDQDQSCFVDGAYLAMDHPALWGQERGRINLSVDGYFARLPPDAKVLMRRTANLAPAVAEVPAGRGRVIVGTAFPDWGAGHGQWSDEAARLTRDLVVYALGGGTADRLAMESEGSVRVKVAYSPSPRPSPVEGEGDMGKIDKIELRTYSPAGVLTGTEERALALAAGQTATLSVPVTTGRELGLGRVAYLLKDAAGEVVQSERTGGVYGAPPPVEVNGVAPGKYELWVTVASENVVRGSTVAYEVHLRNNTDQDLVGASVGVGGHEQGGAWWAFYGAVPDVDVPARGEVTVYFHRRLDLSTAMYFGLYAPGRSPEKLGPFGDPAAWGFFEKGVWAVDPQVRVGAVPSARKYLPGARAELTLTAWNDGAQATAAAVPWSLRGPDGEEAAAGLWEPFLAPGSSDTLRLAHDLPAGRSGLWALTTRLDAGGRRLAGGAAVFELGAARTRLALEAPETWRVEGTTIAVTVANRDTVPTAEGLLLASLRDPAGAAAWEWTAPLPALTPGTTASFSLTPSLGAVKPGAWKLRLAARHDGRETLLTESLPAAAAARVDLDKPSYAQRETATATARAFQTGRWSLEGTTLTLSAPGLGFTSSFPWVPEGEESWMEVPIPDGAAPGAYALSLAWRAGGVEVALATATVVVPKARLEAAWETSAWRAGTAAALRARNAGGVDADFGVTLKLLEPTGETALERSFSLRVRAGEEAGISLPLPAVLAGGAYTVSYEAVAAGGETVAWRRYATVEGSRVTLSVGTDKAVYGPEETVGARARAEGGPTAGTMKLRLFGASAGWSSFLDLGAVTAAVVDGDTAWFGTTGGLKSHDKRRDAWTTHTAAETGGVFEPQAVRGLAVDARGLWVLTPRALFHRAADGTWSKPAMTEDFTGGPFSHVASDGESLWITGSESELFRFRPSSGKKTVVREFQNDYSKPTGIVADEERVYVRYITSRGNAVSVYAFEKPGPACEGEDPPDECRRIDSLYFAYPNGTTLGGLAVDGDDVWWGGGNALHRYRKSDGAKTSFPLAFAPQAIVSHGGTVLAAGMDDEYQARAVFLDEASGETVPYGEEDGLLGETSAVAMDQDFAWFGCPAARGVSRFDRRSQWTSYTEDGMGGSHLRDVALFGREVWVAHECDGAAGHALSRLDAATGLWERRQPCDGSFAGYRAAAADETEIWSGGRHGLARVRREDESEEFFPYHEVHDILMENDAVWILTEGALFRYDRATAASASWALWADGPLRFKKASLSSDGNDLWAAVENEDPSAPLNGAARFSKSDSAWVKSYGAAEGLPSAAVTGIDASAGEAWAATALGPARFDRTADRWVALDGPLAGKRATAASATPGEVWFGSEDGVHRWSRSTGAWKRHGSSDGMPSDRVTALAVDGKHAWIGTEGALSRFRYQGGVVWEKEVPLGEFGAAVDEALAPWGQAGKFTLEGVATSPTGRRMAEASATLTVAPGNLLLTLEADKPFYRDAETVRLAGRLENRGLIEESGTLRIERESAPLLEETATLAPGQARDFEVSFTAAKSEPVTAYFKDVLIEQSVTVESPRVELTLAGPDAAGLEPFTLSLLASNPGRLPVEGTIDFHGDRFPVSIAPGETMIFDQDFAIREESLFRASFQGGASASAEKAVRLGVGATLAARPEAAYAPGTVAVPFTLSNDGSFPLVMDASFALNGVTVTRRLAVPSGETVEDAATWADVPEGVYLMAYDSPLAKGSAAVLVARRDVARVEDLTIRTEATPVAGLRVAGRIVNAGNNVFEGTWRMDAGFAAEEGDLSLPVGGAVSLERLLPLNGAPAGLHAVSLQVLRGENLAGEARREVPILPLWRVEASTAGPYAAGVEGSLSVKVSNGGPVGALARTKAALGDLLDDERSVWLEPGESRTSVFTFTPAEDLEEKTYAGLARVEDGVGGAPAEARFEVPIAGHKVSASAAWDAPAHRPGGTARLTVTARSLNGLAAPLYVKLQSDFYETATATASVGPSPSTWTFDVPVPEGGWTARTLTFGLHAATGRALFLDTLYLYRLAEDLPVALDRSLWVPGDLFSAVVTPPSPGFLDIELPGASWRDWADAGQPYPIYASLPVEMTAGTYRLLVRFTPDGSTTTVSAAYPFDVAGHRVTVKEARLEVPDPAAGTEVSFLFRVDASRALEPVSLTGSLGGRPLFSSTVALAAGETVHRATATLPADAVGPARLRFAFEKPREESDPLLLASGSLDFDVRRPGSLPSWAEVAVSVATGPLSGVTPVAATLTPGLDPARVDFLLDGVLTASRDRPPFLWEWDTRGAAEGDHVVAVVAYDRTGGWGKADTAVLVSNGPPPDTSPPVTALSVGAPSVAVGDALFVSSRTAFRLTAEDASGVVATEYRVDGGSWTLFTSPFALTEEGPRLLEFRSRDAAGNEEVPRSTSVVVDAAPPSIAATAAPPANAAGWHNADVLLSWTGLDAGAGLASCAPPALVTSTGAALSVVGSCVDLLGYVSFSTATLNIDKSSPTVALILPPGSLSGRAAVETAASDDVAVSRRELYVDGLLRSTDTSAYLWDTTMETDGPHTLTAKAYDPAGNAAETVVSVTVANAVGQPPAASFSLPSPAQKGVGRTYSPVLLPVEGTAEGAYKVSFASATNGEDTAAGGYRDIASSTVPVHSGGLAAWDLSGLEGWKTLALTVTGPGGVSRQTVNIHAGDPDLVWTLGAGRREQLHAPRGLATDGEGNLYVAQAGGRGIRKYSPDGRFLGVLGASLSLLEPWGLAVDADGNLIVSDRATHRVMKLSPDGRPLWTLGKRHHGRHVEGNGPGEFDGPVGVATDAGGVVVADRGNGRLQRFDADGNFLAVVDLDEWVPPHGPRWTQGHRHRDDDDDPRGRRKKETRPWGVAVGGSGRLYVTDDRHDRLIIISSAGETLSSEEDLREPRGVAVSPWGDVYVADADGRRIVRFDGKLRRLLSFGDQGRVRLGRPTSLALSNEGRLHVTDRAGEAVKSFDAPGTPPVEDLAPATAMALSLGGAPEPFTLRETYAYPNPARGGRNPVIRSEGAGMESITIRIYDAAGGLVHEARPSATPSLLDDGASARLVYDYAWDASSEPSGVYMCVVEAAGASGETVRKTAKIALVK